MFDTTYLYTKLEHIKDNISYFHPLVNKTRKYYSSTTQMVNVAYIMQIYIVFLTHKFRLIIIIAQIYLKF